MHVALLVIGLSLCSADFSICTAVNNQYYPVAQYANNQYYVFWTDYRFLSSRDTSYALYGARITATGTVLDPNGKYIFKDSVFNPRVAYDGTNLLAVWREGC